MNLVKGRASIDLENVNKILDKIEDKPIAVISVAGPKRTGKSFLLGYFLRLLQSESRENWFESQLSSQFVWRKGSERTTTGILWWSEPFYMNINGVETAILLMDSQGTFDDKTTYHENASIFALSSLLSSMMIYYQRSDISEDMLQQLQFFAQFAKMHVNFGDQSDYDEYEEKFQNLTILIRDWFFEEYNYGYYDDYESQTPERNVKKDKLDSSENFPREVQIVHRSVLDSFENVGVYLLPYAGQALAMKGDSSNLEPDFIFHFKGFVERMLDSKRIPKKRIGGQLVTGKSLKIYIEKWREYFLSAEAPEAKTLQEATAEIQNLMAVQTAITGYNQLMKDALDKNVFSEEELKTLHDKCSADSVDVFNNAKKVGDKEFKEKFVQKLNEMIDHEFEKFKQINEANRKHAEEKKILNKKLRDQEIDAQRYKEEAEKRERQYQEDLRNARKKRNFFEKIGEIIDDVIFLRL